MQVLHGAPYLRVFASVHGPICSIHIYIYVYLDRYQFKLGVFELWVGRLCLFASWGWSSSAFAGKAHRNAPVKGQVYVKRSRKSSMAVS